MTIERETLAIVYVLHKFRHYLLGNKFMFYVDHMVLLYMVRKPQISKKITRWLLLFLEYDFLVIYKLWKSHYVADALSWMPNLIEESGIPDQTIDTTLFLLQFVLVPHYWKKIDSL